MSLHLNADEVFSILQFLDAHSVLTSCLPVNKMWHQVSTSNAIWQPLCHSMFMEYYFELVARTIDFDERHAMTLYTMDHELYFSIFRTLFHFPKFQSEVLDVKTDVCENIFRLPDAYCELTSNPKLFGIKDVEITDDKESNEINSIKYRRAKLALLLTILSSENIIPNIWKDQVIISRCTVSESRNNVEESTAIPLAAFCLCVMFDEIHMLDGLVGKFEDDQYLAVSPFVESSAVKPFCYLKFMEDEFLVGRDDSYRWTVIENENENCVWVPILFNAGVRTSEYSFTVTFSSDEKTITITRTFDSYY